MFLKGKGGVETEKRLVSFLCAFAIITGALILRIAEIGINENTKEASAMQSRKVLDLSETRAGIFDRNLEPLVNKNLERRVLVFPDILEVSVLNSFFDRDSLAEIFGKKEPSVLDIDGKIVEGEGIFNFSYPKRYSEKNLKKF